MLGLALHYSARLCQPGLPQLDMWPNPSLNVMGFNSFRRLVRTTNPHPMMRTRCYLPDFSSPTLSKRLSKNFIRVVCARRHCFTRLKTKICSRPVWPQEAGKFNIGYLALLAIERIQDTTMMNLGSNKTGTTEYLSI